MSPQSRIYVAGHAGLVGSAIVRRLNKSGYRNVLVRSREELDLCDEAGVEAFFATERPGVVVLAAARVGGILANSTFRADFILDNLRIQTNVIGAAHRHGTRRLLFLGSSCIYPRECPQPIREEYLLTGPLEPTNRPYAIAKIAGIELCEALNAQHGTRYQSVMPTNLYGPNDNFDPETSHVLPALIRRFHEAREQNAAAINIWGSGTPKREFLHVDDLADACVFLLEETDSTELVNIGVGRDISIADLAALIANVVGFKGVIRYDASKPDGTPRKLLDVSKLNALGWKSSVELEAGIRNTYEWYQSNCLGA
ncbi:MAG: GDP-L-fucose synthase [Myxococcales bacterium]|nr:GDP-L-fucose synthase [Myxococcales bacterium]